MITRILLSTAIICLVASSCFGQANNTRRGALTGGAAGAIIGGIIGNQNDETPEGVLIGGAVGAIAGGLLGNQQDQLNQQRYRYRQQQAYRQAVDFSSGVSINDVVALSQSGVASSIVIQQIQTNGVKQRIGVNEIIALHQQGVNKEVIGVMQQARLAGVESRVQKAPVRTVYQTRPVVVHQPIVVERYVPVRPPYGSHPHSRPRYSSPRHAHYNFHYRR